MEIRQLKYFISAATHRNFTKAAKECFIVQTAMTAQMANLEKELGVKLFERQSRGLALTAAGEAFLAEAREIVARSERVQAKMSAFQGGYTDLLQIGFHGELFRRDLVETLRTFRLARPETKVMLYQLPRSELVSGVRDGQLDLAFMGYAEFFQKHEKWMAWQVLGEEATKLVVSKDHPLAGRREITMAEVNRLPRCWISWGTEEGTPVGEPSGETAAQIYGQVQDHASMEALIESGYCVGLWGERICSGTERPGLRYIPVSDFTKRIEAAVIWRREGLSPAGEAFRQLMEKEWKQGG